MPRSESDIWKLYSVKTDCNGKKVSATCVYCGIEYKFPNATRLTEHVVSRCKKCPSVPLPSSSVAGDSDSECTAAKQTALAPQSVNQSTLRTFVGFARAVFHSRLSLSSKLLTGPKHFFFFVQHTNLCQDFFSGTVF